MVQLAFFQAMQFSNAMQHILQHVTYANPAHGPVSILNCDLAYGFYWIPLATSATLLGVILHYNIGNQPLIVFLLVLPMGWSHIQCIY
jgi:hypothetical protein